MSPVSIKSKKSTIDWIAFSAALTLCALGLITMDSFASPNPFFLKQLVVIILGVLVFFGASKVDWRFLRRPAVAASIFGAVIVPLLALILLGHAVKGAKSWFTFGSLGFEPVEFVKLALIIALAKYFSRRHT